MNPEKPASILSDDAPGSPATFNHASRSSVLSINFAGKHQAFSVCRRLGSIQYVNGYCPPFTGQIIMWAAAIRGRVVHPLPLYCVPAQGHASGLYIRSCSQVLPVRGNIAQTPGLTAPINSSDQ